jgi:hypothetical protein
MRTSYVTTCILTVFATACGGGGEEPGPGTTEAEPTVLEAELMGGRDFMVEHSVGPEASAHLVASGVALAGPTAFALDIEGGTASVEIESGALTVRDLQVHFSGIDHPVVGDVVLDEMVLVLEEPRTFAVEASDDQVIGHTTLPFRVDWWLSTDGDDIPLESQRVDALPVTLRIEREGAGLRLDLELRQDTTVFALDGALDVESIDVQITGRTPDES